ncbi:MAG: methyltransferase [Caulobacterales bacterium]|nr:methyltransferase [Caulobacterales bacterium]
MSKLSKAQYRTHQQACDLLTKDRLTEDDRWFVLENWQESARHVNSQAGAFFTPPMLARDFAIETCGPRIIDLCAGIGMLAFMAWNKSDWGRQPIELVCVEQNPDYVEVGRKVLPEATWIVGDIFALPNLGHFDCAIGNPPFGATPRAGTGPRYRGRAFEYHVIDVASDIADWGTFIIPQTSAPFRYSGQPHYEWRPGETYEAFRKQTGIELGANCGIDCDFHKDGWRGVAPTVEIVTADFQLAREARRPAQVDLFEAVA